MSDLVGFPTARLQSRASLLGTWTDGGTLRIYDGERPVASGGAITTQVLLCEWTLYDPAGAAADGVWVCSPLPAPAINLREGTAAWARLTDSAATVVCDLSVGATGSGEALILDNVRIVEGATTDLVSFTITET